MSVHADTANTCVSSRHSREYITVLKLMTELTFKKNFLNTYSWTFFKELLTDITHKPVVLLTYILIMLVLNCHTNRPYTSCGGDFFESTTFGYAQS